MFLPIGDNIQRRTLPIVPAALIFVNVLVFALEMRFEFSGPHGEDALYDFVTIWGLTPSGLAQGDVVGLLGYMFLHGDFLHIIGNMVILWAFACSLEVGLGRWTLLGFYMLFGLVAGLAHAAMNWGSEVPLIGASGAIAGLIGAYTVLYGPRSKIRTLVFFWFRVYQVQVPALLFGVGWIGLQVYEAASDPGGIEGIAWYAHIGGFVAGALTMYLCRHETEMELTEDREGNLVFADPNEPPPVSDIELLQQRQSTPYPVPASCSKCGQSLSEQQRLAFNLARCGNPSCQRMIYLEYEQPAECFV